MHKVSSSRHNTLVMERGWKPNVEFSPNCPRCGSSNTKFCYYNNYSLTQPRYFCKGCRRYWTKGGSLRNVPVGGGCRKNRRAKSLRLSTDGVGSKNLSYVSSSNQATGSSYGPSNGNSIVDSTSSSVGHDGASHIDLALVYANFLNQQPESKSHGDEISELPCNNFDQMPQEFTSLSNANIQDSSCIQLLEDNAQAAGFLGLSDRFGETHLSESCDHLYFNGFESLNRGQDRFQHPPTSGAETSYALPPLPGEDLASQETVWSSQLMVSHNPVQSTQLPVLAPDAQDTNLLLGNWNPFELSSDHTFSSN